MTASNTEQAGLARDDESSWWKTFLNVGMVVVDVAAKVLPILLAAAAQEGDEPSDYQPAMVTGPLTWEVNAGAASVRVTNTDPDPDPLRRIVVTVTQSEGNPSQQFELGHGESRDVTDIFRQDPSKKKMLDPDQMISVAVANRTAPATPGGFLNWLGFCCAMISTGVFIQLAHGVRFRYARPSPNERILEIETTGTVPVSIETSGTTADGSRFTANLQTNQQGTLVGNGLFEVELPPGPDYGDTLTDVEVRLGFNQQQYADVMGLPVGSSQ